jgi:hypothetical protein
MLNYTKEIHFMNARQVWDAWKAQKLNVGQVAEWQRRHNTYFTPNGEIEPWNSYNIVVNSQEEKHQIIDEIHAIGAILTGVSGYYDGYYIQLDATPSQVFILNKKLGGAA